jgi:hypothetical protein
MDRTDSKTDRSVAEADRAKLTDDDMNTDTDR